MNKVVVFLTKDYKLSKTIEVNEGLTKNEITEIVDKKFSTWYYYDIC